jgi:hypothetical protein
MSAPESYPVNGPEYVDNAEIAEIIRLNQITREVNFAGKLAEFRASVFSKLASHGLLKDDVNWAIFDIDAQHDGSVALVADKVQVLVLVMRPSAEQHANSLIPSTIRIVTKEMMSIDEHLWCMTHDYTVDHEGDAWEHITAVDTIGERSRSDIHVPLFSVYEEGILSIGANFGLLTPRLTLYDEADEEVTPFGNLLSVDGKMASLLSAEAVMKQVLQLDPVHSA